MLLYICLLHIRFLLYSAPIVLSPLRIACMHLPPSPLHLQPLKRPLNSCIWPLEERGRARASAAAARPYRRRTALPLNGEENTGCDGYLKFVCFVRLPKEQTQVWYLTREACSQGLQSSFTTINDDVPTIEVFLTLKESFLTLEASLKLPFNQKYITKTALNCRHFKIGPKYNLNPKCTK